MPKRAEARAPKRGIIYAASTLSSPGGFGIPTSEFQTRYPINKSSQNP